MEDNLITTITSLIEKKTEGSYWDFKECWHINKADLLHDIICLANNIVNKDAYIIIGVTNSGEVTNISNDSNRRDTAKLTDFLRTKKFVGQFRPIVRVETLSIKVGIIDVIIVENSTNTPFVLEEDFSDSAKKSETNHINDSKEKIEIVRQGNVYTRIQDTNTPKNKTADFDKVEKSWRKRFYLDASPFEKLNLYLKDTGGWELNYFQNEWYYKFSNELFKISDIRNNDTEKTNTVWDYIGIYSPWSKHNIEIIWQNVIIKTYKVLSNCKYSAIMPNCEFMQFDDNNEGYWYWFYVKDSDTELLQKLLERDNKNIRNPLEPIQFDFYKENIIRFESENEKNEFEKYLSSNWITLKIEFYRQQDNQFIDNIIFQQDFKCIKFFPKIFMHWKARGLKLL
jgi:hypothetical protein